MTVKNGKPGAKGRSDSGKAAKAKDVNPPKPQLPVTVISQTQPGSTAPIDNLVQAGGSPASSNQEQAGGQALAGAQVSVGRHITVDLEELNAAVRRIGDREQPGQPAAGSGLASTEGRPGATSASCASSTAKSTPGLAVTSSRDGFWRAGRQWSKDQTLVRLTDLSKEQVAQLKAEPMLTVADVDHVPAEAAGA